MTAENMKKIIIDMSSAPQWVAFAITGVLTIPPVELGLGPNMWLIENPKHTSHGFDKLFSAVEESFKSFNLADHTHLTLDNIKVILIPMKDTSPKGIKVALDCADAALSIFNKMVPMTHTRLISWHRRQGLAVGAIYSNGHWTPINQPNFASGPALIQAPDTSSWDQFLTQLLRGELSPLGTALQKCMSWNSESQRTANVAHRFAFSWIGLESMLPDKEKDQAGSKKRLPLLVATASKYYSRALRGDEQLHSFLSNHPNPNGKLWRDEIERMYAYRCEVFHEGVTDFTSQRVEPEQADWYSKIADFLCDRVVMLAGVAFADDIRTLEEFWDLFLPRFLLTEECQWFKSGVLFGNHVIEHDWRSGIHPEINRI
ncbi:HEPN domain-containing protein [Stenotrophomonas maltophilia]|uniref:HEPN domain-containing protein n=1 Tax=Stenotrophomonas TaxID=40323 RepID=UPI0012F83627|nr:HEPN domain-containing protein [Stenotrophomonas sp. SKA14]